MIEPEMPPAPGDVGFVSNSDFTSWWIKFAQRRKYGNHSPVTRWNHVFMVTDILGHIVEANQSGVELGNLSKYAGQDFEIRRPRYVTYINTENAARHVPAGEIAADAVDELIGDHYGFLTIASVALSLLTGTKLRFGLDGTEICSGAVSYALTRANIDVGQDAEFNTPADLFSYAIAQNWTRP